VATATFASIVNPALGRLSG